MRCKLCRQPAVYAPLRFCTEHFLAFFEKRVRKYLDSIHLKQKRILIGVSGGKDSSALAEVLARLKEEYELDLTLFCIDLKIPDYSDKGVAVVKQLAERTGLPLIVEDLASYEKQIPDFAGAGEKPCGACGTIKRFLLNKVAVDRGFDFVATGHNLDDEFFFAMHNLLHRNVVQLRRQEKMLVPRPELKLAGRVKPLFYLTEKENRLYCLLREIPHDTEECPYSVGNPQIAFKQQFAGINREEKRSLLKSLQKLQQPEEDATAKRQSGTGRDTPVGDDAGQIHPCPECSFPTTSSSSCVFCKLMAGERKGKK